MVGADEGSGGSPVVTVELPIKGMTKTPLFLGIDGGAGFVSCLMFCSQDECALESFKIDSGHDLRSIIPKNGLEALIDSATGFDAHKGEIVAKFADWVVEKIWGEDLT